MSESEILIWLKNSVGPVGLVLMFFFWRSVKAVTPHIVSLYNELILFRSKWDEFNKLFGRVDKLERDASSAHQKIRALEARGGTDV